MRGDKETWWLAKLILYFVSLGLPSLKGSQRQAMAYLCDGHLLLCIGQEELLLDKGIIEACGRGVTGRGGEIDVCRTRPVNGAEAHGTRFTTAIDNATGEFKVTDGLAGFAYGNDFSVGCGIKGGS